MGNPTGDAVSATTSPTVPQDGVVQTVRPRCQYGEKCFRKNPEHKAGFSHPGDLDWNTTSCVACATQVEDPPADHLHTSSPTPGISEEVVEDKGLVGALGGAAVAAGGIGAAHHMGAFQEGRLGDFARRHPGMALAAGIAAIGVGALAGHKLEDAACGKHGKKSKKDKKEKKDKKGKKDKKSKKSKKDKKHKSRDIGGDDTDSDSSSSDSSSDDERDSRP